MRIWKVCGFLGALLITCEVGLRIAGFGPIHHFHLVPTPPDIFKTDKTVGWRLRPGSYILSAVDSSNRFKVTINKDGNRITSVENDSANILQKCASIQIYGCSCTFGFSVDDTATESFKLQQMLPDVKVKNKGVPGYGLAQMFLLLKETVAKGDTPTVAVFNYANFHDWRTPRDRSWSALIGYAITAGYSPMFRNMEYPYFDFAGDSLELYYTPFNDLSKDWPLREQSALVNTLNTISYGVPDVLNRSHGHMISEKLAFEMMLYCKSHKIIPVLATITPSYTDILDSLSVHGFYTLNYNVSFLDHRKTNKYNCGPVDPDHPSILTHSIYAKELFDFLQKKQLLCSR